MPAVAALLHEDSELLGKLRAAGLLEGLKAIVREQLDPLADIPLGLEFRFSRDEIVRPLFEAISTSVPIQGVQKYIDDILQLIAQTDAAFDAAWLYDQLNRRTDGGLPVTQQHVDDILTLLNLRGFLTYDSERRSYCSDPDQLLRSLAAPITASKTPEAHINQKTERQEKRQ
jgi:hypothetical protein